MDNVDWFGELDERGDLGLLRGWLWRLIHVRVKRENSGRKVVSVVQTWKEVKGLT